MDKTEIINFRVSSYSYELIKKWAQKYGVKLSPFCLFIIMDKITELEMLEQCNIDPKRVLNPIDLTTDQEDSV